MPTTSNFGWTTPADTDLVKDGAAAIRTLGNGIDTSFLDLKGGTTGQVLSKASNTDLDFSWVAQDDSNAIQNAIVDAKGDLISATAADTPARLAVGANGTVLTADSAEATGLKWATPASGGGYTQLATSTPSSATTVSFTSISGSYKHLLVTWSELYNDSHGGHGWGVRLNNDSASNYAMAGIRFNFSSPTKQAQAENYTAESMFYGDYVMAPIGNASNSQWNKTSNGFFIIYDYANTSYKKVVNWGAYNWNNSDSGINAPVMINGIYNSNSAITRLDFIRSSSQTLNGGIIRLYGVS